MDEMTLGIAIAAGSAGLTADGLSTGGMSIIDGNLITAIFTGMAAVISAIGTILWMKHKSAKAVRPLDSDDTWVTHGECKAHRCALEKRIDEIGPALNRIFKKLNENDLRSEERANQMHRRIDPLIEKVAAHGAELEIIKGKMG